MFKRLIAPKQIVLPRVRVNAGIEAYYRTQLDALVSDMQKSIDYWLTATWRANTPVMAQDASPAAMLRTAMRKLATRWTKNFNAGADKLGKLFADKTLKHTDVAFKDALKKAGFAIEFTMTPIMQDAYTAIIGEQVGLIRSIAQQHLTQVQTVVMQGVQNGRDLAYIHDELRARFGVTKRRAALIARDQSNKATSTLNRARQAALGLKKGRWHHSHAGKVPRPSHVAADGEIFDIEQGMFLDGKWTHPGEEINCRCTWSAIIPGLEDEEI